MHRIVCKYVKSHKYMYTQDCNYNTGFYSLNVVQHLYESSNILSVKECTS